MWTVEEAINCFRTNGSKITEQREAIIKRLHGRTDHPSAEMIYKEVATQYPSISYATVYSTTQMMVQFGLIQNLSISSKRTYFDPNVEPHAHFFCSKCDRLFDVEIDKTVFNQNILEEHPFIASISKADVFIYGECKKCTPSFNQ